MEVNIREGFVRLSTVIQALIVILCGVLVVNAWNDADYYKRQYQKEEFATFFTRFPPHLLDANPYEGQYCEQFAKRKIYNDEECLGIMYQKAEQLVQAKLATQADMKQAVEASNEVARSKIREKRISDIKDIVIGLAVALTVYRIFAFGVSWIWNGFFGKPKTAK